MDRRSRHNLSSKPSSHRGSRAGSSMAGGSHARFSKSFLGSRSNLLTGSRRNLTSESMKFSKPQAQIFDEYGNDVTPAPLLESDKLKRNQSNVYGTDGPLPSASLFQHSIYGTGPGSASFSQPFSKSVYSSSVTDLGTVSMKDSLTEEILTGKTVSSAMQNADENSLEKIVSEVDLDQEVNITLSETETIWMLDIPGICVVEGSPEADSVTVQNECYLKLLEGKAGNDLYSERGMQTINDGLKVKQNQTDNIASKDESTMSTAWEMYDTYRNYENMVKEKTEDESLEELSSRAASRLTSGTSHRAPTVMSTAVGKESTVPGESLFVASMITEANMTLPFASKTSNGSSFDPCEPNEHPVLKSDTLRESFVTIERAITQNLYQPKQALYRGLNTISDPEVPITVSENISLKNPHLEKLWSFSCPLTKKRNVSCLAWNRVNLDIVAAGYGDFGSKSSRQSTGLVCCWSLKNPLQPERWFNTSSGVTSVSFSKKYPNLLAAGLYSGAVILFNVRSTVAESVLDSRDAVHKHSAPVWQVSWVSKDSSIGDTQAEMLVSISVDGKVLQWSIRKGFESVQLMKLKRMVTPKQQQKKMKVKQLPTRVNPAPGSQVAAGSVSGEAYISQHAPGMGFDFSPSDSNIYLACTEEGYIHKCSCSYNEQVLETYTGHNGPVYRVLWSPFVPSLFLSCSADWSIKLWSHDNNSPLQSFHSTQKSIFDVCWSPLDSRMFGCVSDGRIEIWNMENNMLDPMILHKPLPAVQQTCISFAYNAQVVLVGDEVGVISVYLLKNIPSPSTDQVEALLRVVSSSSQVE